jgi:hypothetical protein
MSTLYDTDFFKWTQEQAAALAAGKAQDLDWANLAEEIESLGKRDRDKLRSYLEGLLVHLLKWAYQPDYRSRSWRDSVEENRARVPDCLAESPSLRPQLPELMAWAYRHARLKAARQTRMSLATFPERCPWTPEQVMDEDFWPGENGREGGHSDV